VRYKNLEKRDKIFRKRKYAGIKKMVTVFRRLISMQKKRFDLPEIYELIEVNSKMFFDRYDWLEKGISFSSDELDGLPSTAIDKYIARQESVVTEWEESMAKAEATQVRIKELMDSLGQS